MLAILVELLEAGGDFEGRELLVGEAPVHGVGDFVLAVLLLRLLVEVLQEGERRVGPSAH